MSLYAQLQRREAEGRPIRIGLRPEQAERGGLNPKLFNSFLDGSKPSIESAAMANATGLSVPSNDLQYPPASVEDIPAV